MGELDSIKIFKVFYVIITNLLSSFDTEQDNMGFITYIIKQNYNIMGKYLM